MDTLSRTRPAKGTLVGPRIPALITAKRDLGFSAEARPNGAVADGQIAQMARVDEIVRATFSGRFSSDPGVRYGDGYYYLPTDNEVRTILAASQLDRRTYMEERFDCDDYAYVLKGEMSAHAYDAGELRYGLATGMIWCNVDWVGGFHALNWFVNDKQVIQLIEPQNDGIYPAEHCTGAISLLLI